MHLSYAVASISHILKPALKYLRQAGFVHRDVSAGNCLYFAQDNLGKISDLEYATRYDDMSINGVERVIFFCFYTACMHCING